MKLRVVSWNVHRCIGTDGHYSPERVASVLRSLKPDIVALQEVDSSLLTEGEIDQLTAIASQTGFKSLMGPTMQRGYGVYGNALLYRFDLQSFEERDLSYRRFEPRGALAASLQTESGKALRIINTHLGLKYWERVYQIDRLLSSFPSSEDELSILAGDFNEWLPLSPNFLRLSRPFQACPKLKTFPSRWPRFSLDRILVAGPWKAAQHSVISHGDARVASDHLPIVADLYSD